MQWGTHKKSVDVKVENIHKRFDAQEVLKGISLDIKAGEIFVIMGPSGSGKSVLLKSIIGLIQAEAGRVLVDGQDAQNPQTYQDTVASMVFQTGALFNSMSVYDNLAFYPREHRLCPESQIASEVKKILQMLGLEKAANKMPSELSGGMRKRVAIARSLMMKPQLMLYDEPTSELDPIMAASIASIIGGLRRVQDVTSIVVSHDRDLALSVGDRVALLIDGEIVAQDTPEKLKASKDKRVQEFLNPKIDLKRDLNLKQSA